MSTCNCHCFSCFFLLLSLHFPSFSFPLLPCSPKPRSKKKKRKSSTVMLVSKMRGHAAEDEDFGCRGAERGGLEIVSSEGKLPPATVTSLQHSFPQSWNNRDPHHSPHLCLPFALSHTFLASLFFHADPHRSGKFDSTVRLLPPSSLVEEGSRPHKVWLWNLTTIFLLISGPDIAQTHSGGELQTQQSSFFIALSDITHCCAPPPFPS